MTWTELHKRMDVLDEILARAEHDVESAVDFTDIPGAIEAYGSGRNIMLALQYRWNNHLAARLDDDYGTTLEEANSQLAAEQPALRAVLDAGAQELERRPQQRMDQPRTRRPYAEVRA